MSKQVRIRIGVSEAARMFARLGVIVSTQTVRRLAKAEKLDAVRVGARILIAPASVEAAAKRK